MRTVYRMLYISVVWLGSIFLGKSVEYIRLYVYFCPALIFTICKKKLYYKYYKSL